LKRLVLLALVAACRSPSPPPAPWHEVAGYRWRDLAAPGTLTPGFTQLTHTGIAFTNTVSDSALVHNRQLAQGAGVCLADVDGDGLPDVFLARTEGANALYRNLGGWRFADSTASAGVAGPGGGRHSTGCAFADLDGDGDQDLILVSLGGGNAVFINDGKGHFTERALPDTAGSMTVAVADVDGDGDLDVYIANNKAYTTLDRMSPQERSFGQVTRQPGPNQYEVREPYRRDYRLADRPDLGGISLEQRADPDFFYVNDGAGHFTREPLAHNPRFLDASGKQLTDEPEYFGLAAMFVDLNNDGAPDLYVANDFEDPDQYWVNDGRGHFRLAPWYALRSTSNSGMAIAVGDVNRDGAPDLFEVDMLSRDTKRLKTEIPTHTAVLKQPGMGSDRPQMQRNTLQLNRGDGTFAEIARYAGLGASGWTWSTEFLDVDLDGWEDILVGTGHVSDIMDGDTQYRLRSLMSTGAAGGSGFDWRRMLFEYPSLKLPNMAFRNRGDLTFEDASTRWRFDLGPDISHGMALADLDGDGDLDVVINRLGSPAAVLRNDATAPRVEVRLRGKAPNTAGLGSRVRVLGGPVPLQEREIVGGGSYLSSSDASLTFATGAAAHVRIEVDWRDGARSVIDSALPNREYEVIEPPTANAARPTSHVAVRPLLEDVSSQLGGHEHVEPLFNDYARQPLLPNALSQLGPGVAWADVDGDGLEDLVVGTGRTGTLTWFKNLGSRLQAASIKYPPAVGDLTTVLSSPLGILTGVSSYEQLSADAVRSTPSVLLYSAKSNKAIPIIPGERASTGPLALADYDGDGALDLFVGGRVIPGGYPVPASSRLYKSVNGSFVPDSVNDRLLRDVGLVSAAQFADLNGDGWPDLILAIEWGEIRIFLNDHGRFSPASFPGLSGLISRWNGVATGDLDGDGRLDIVATSWGRNTDHQARPDDPLYLYWGLFSGRPDVLLAQRDPRINAVAPLESFDRLVAALPGLPQRVRGFTPYADATIDQVLGSRAAEAIRLTATTMDNMVFLNRGDHFEARAMPAEAQLAPAFYAGIADFDGDGKEDVFLSQNFFATAIPVPRYDAGRGLLLLGDGNGGLEPVSGQRSGLEIYGEQRGAAYADFDGDGRLDLAVSENGAPTRLFRNVGAKPGLRVRLIGPPGNPTGIGTQLRLRYGDSAGPVREIDAGSGYWSQNGGVQVLGHSGEPTALWVRWSGGREQVVPLTKGQREITVYSPK